MRNGFLLNADKTFRVSKPAVVLLVTTIILLGFLAVGTIQNLDRGQKLMELSFLRQGTTMIQSFEAATRTSLLFHKESRKNPLVDLISEFVKDGGVAYIRIIDEQNHVIVSQGNIPQAMVKEYREMQNVGNTPISVISWSDGIFEVTKQFIPVAASKTGMTMMHSHWEQWNRAFKAKGKMLISVGFFTEGFEATRKEDMHHAIFMLLMLLLLGFAGLYFLYLYQKMKVTHDTLLNTRLYADNVLESIPDGLITLDPDDNIVSCNRNADNMLGKTMDDITDKPILEIFPGCPPETLKSGGHSIELEALCQLATDESIPVKVSSSRLIDHLGNWIGRVLVLKDIGEIRKMEIQLERSRRLAALGEMAAGIAHEVRNPLSTLRGFAHFFGSEEGASDACQKYAQFMKTEIDRLNQLVSELLQFGTLKELTFDKVDIDSMLDKIVTLLDKDFLEHGIRFSYLKEKNVPLYGDSDLLLQVILNLLKNSIKATPEGGKISLDFLTSNSGSLICVKDSGEGMTELTQSKMFDPFFSASKGGTGIGLAVCHQIVEQHHGYFEVTSEVGQGATVTIVLPQMEKNYV